MLLEVRKINAIFKIFFFKQIFIYIIWKHMNYISFISGSNLFCMEKYVRILYFVFDI